MEHFTCKGIKDNCSAIFLVSAKIDPNLKLDCVSLGKSKNILDKIDLNSTIELFGPLLQETAVLLKVYPVRNEALLIF